MYQVSAVETLRPRNHRTAIGYPREWGLSFIGKHLNKFPYILTTDRDKVSGMWSSGIH